MIKRYVHRGKVFLIYKDTMVFGIQDDAGDYNYQSLYCFSEEEREELKIGDEVESYYDAGTGRRKAERL